MERWGWQGSGYPTLGLIRMFLPLKSSLEAIGRLVDLFCCMKIMGGGVRGGQGQGPIHLGGQGIPLLGENTEIRSSWQG